MWENGAQLHDVQRQSVRKHDVAGLHARRARPDVAPVDDGSLRLAELSGRAPSLEEAFLQLTGDSAQYQARNLS